ncbi:NB-ARC domain-containing protein [Streptomyces abikoensis]|uniref:DUF7779 domain-containing protein n=1 Tax=Streptomyces abikoensis TaxID=97398 RepID=UPI0033D0E94F
MPAAWPHQVGVIPSQAQSFQRRAEAERLRSAADGGSTTVLNQVLTGLGGVGKTQLAADYARTAWDDGNLNVLVWITASARSPVVTRYAQARAELCPGGDAAEDPDQAATAFLAWLTPKEGQQPCRWLIVLDDVADPDDLRGLWPPASPYGRTLVTTRRRDAALTGEGRRLVDVGLFTEVEALAYLTTSLAAHDRHEPTAQLTALARDLGWLPLALSQAAAYLIDSGETAAAYRDLLTNRATRLADLAPNALPDEQTDALAAAWSLSLDRADILRPAGLAQPMLQMAALLDANGIPEKVLTGEATRTRIAAYRTAASQRPPEEPAPVSRLDAVRALRVLHRLSLIDHTPDTPHQAVRVHQLIQRATRDTLTPKQLDQHARTAADALVAAWPDIERDTTLAQALRANAAALTRHAEDALYRPGAHRMLYRLGQSLGDSGQVNAATTHFQHLADTTTRHLGPDHPATLAARDELARYRTRTDVAVCANALPDMVRVLGEDHPQTLYTRSALAYLRGRAGDAAGAVAAYAELLPDLVRVLGEDDYDTLMARQHLASSRGEAGDAAGAAAAYAELLPDLVRVLGEDYPQTLYTRSDLAYWRGEAGDAAGAVAAYTELLLHQVRLLGEHHPDTLTTRGELIGRQEAMGQSTVDQSTD